MAAALMLGRPTPGQIAGADPVRDIASLSLKANELMRAGRYQEAHSFAIRAERAAALLGATDPLYADTLNQTGLLNSYLGQYAEAERCYRHAISIVENDLKQRPLLIVLLQNLSSVYMYHGARYAQAERNLLRALQLSNAVMPPDSAEVGVLLGNLGAAQMLLRRDAEARGAFDRALAILQDGPEQYRTNAASALMNIGFLEFRRGDAAEGIRFFHRSIELYQKALGPTHPELLRPLINLGRAYLHVESWAMAEKAFRRAAEIAEALPSGHPIWREFLGPYAVALRKNGKKADSREVENRAKALRELNPDTGRMTISFPDLVKKSSRK